MSTRLFVLSFALSSTLSAQLSITTPSLVPGTVGTPLTTTNLAATGGTAPYIWSGAPPSGLTLNADTGVITGTPNAAGAFSFEVTVTDSAKPSAAKAGKVFGLTISPFPADTKLEFAADPACPGEDGKPKKECDLGDTVAVKFTNLDKWCISKDNDPKTLVLILDGRVMSGLHPIAPMPCNNELRFDLRRMADDQDTSKLNQAAWNAIMSRASTARKTIALSVGIENKPACYGSRNFTLRVFPWYTWLVFGFLGVLLVIFVLLARYSDVLRDPGIAGVEPDRSQASTGFFLRLFNKLFTVDKPSKLPYSLARCQMAWWFFTVLGSYFYIWMVTGDRDSLTPGVLILIGISAATGLGAVVIDSGKMGQRKSLEQEQVALRNRIAAIGPAPVTTELQNELKQKSDRLIEVRAAIERLPAPPKPTQGFIRDILRDGDSVSFHRFQMAAWTIVLGFVLIREVYKNLAMPDFSATLLGLMGISSGTYIGFKIPDPPKSEPANQ